MILSSEAASRWPYLSHRSKAALMEWHRRKSKGFPLAGFGELGFFGVSAEELQLLREQMVSKSIDIMKRLVKAETMIAQGSAEGGDPNLLRKVPNILDEAEEDARILGSDFLDERTMDIREKLDQGLTKVLQRPEGAIMQAHRYFKSAKTREESKPSWGWVDLSLEFHHLDLAEEWVDRALSFGPTLGQRTEAMTLMDKIDELRTFFLTGRPDEYRPIS